MNHIREEELTCPRCGEPTPATGTATEVRGDRRQHTICPNRQCNAGLQRSLNVAENWRDLGTTHPYQPYFVRYRVSDWSPDHDHVLRDAGLDVLPADVDDQRTIKANAHSDTGAQMQIISILRGAGITTEMKLLQTTLIVDPSDE